eukprot:gene30306-35295_t
MAEEDDFNYSFDKEDAAEAETAAADSTDVGDVGSGETAEAPAADPAANDDADYDAEFDDAPEPEAKVEEAPGSAELEPEPKPEPMPEPETAPAGEPSGSEGAAADGEEGGAGTSDEHVGGEAGAEGGEKSEGEEGETGAEPSPQGSEEAQPKPESFSMSMAETAKLAQELLVDEPASSGTILQQASNQSMGGGSARGSAQGSTTSRQGSAPGSRANGSAGSASATNGASAPNEAEEAGPREPAPPPPPHYLHATLVMPKGAHQGYKNAGKEHIENVWSTGTSLARGIRSLPNALSPDYRINLYDEIIEGAKNEKSGVGPMFKALGLAYGNESGPNSVQLAAGQRAVPKEHPYAGSFSTYEHLPSEYDRQQLLQKFERLKKKLAQIHPLDFVVKATPAGPKSAPAFNEYDYPVNSYDGLEDATSRARIMSGPFHAGGKYTPAATLRGQANECMMNLCKVLSADWPSAFLQTFEDRSGSIVISFDKVEALSQGDLGNYMNNFAKCNHLVSEFRLLKDASQWGMVDEDTQTIFYVLWPPWVRHRFFGSPAAEHVFAATAASAESEERSFGSPSAEHAFVATAAAAEAKEA